MRRRGALLLGLILLAGTAAAQTPPASETPALRGLPAGDPTDIQPRIVRPESWSVRPEPARPDPTLISPGLLAPPAPRLRGIGAEPLGGAACRMACATDLYQCHGGESGDHCDRSWSACVLACPAVSGAL